MNERNQINDIEALQVLCENLERDIVHLKRHDQLTGLLNRTEFMTEVEGMLIEMGSSGPQSAMLEIGVRGLPRISGSLGRHASDYIVSALASRLNQDPPPGGVCCRLDYWSFAVFLPVIADPLQAMSEAKRLIGKLTEPVDWVDRKISLDVCAGVALTTQGESDAVSLLHNAGLAQKAAAERGSNSYSFFNPALAQAARRRSEIQLAIGEAIGKNQLYLHYQPVFSLSKNSLVGFEALLRFEHPELGKVSPAEFIPVAEETGSISKIGAWALAEACKTAINWPAHMTVAVNISPEQFYSGALISDVHNALELSSFPAYRLEIEVTESTMLKDSDVVISQLNALREMGCTIVMDDFGTGYSSLSYLWKFPFSKLKIDKSFVHALESTPMVKGMLKAIVDLSRNIGLKVTAEGIETSEQAELVRSFGCDFVQGYLCGKPVAQSEIAAIIIKNFSDQLRNPQNVSIEQILPIQQAG
jgi:predicted signal transduction protein with EAL and GGDEF domain